MTATSQQANLAFEREERAHLQRLVPGMQVEEWPGRGRFVHLAEVDRFAARLYAFADLCDGARS